MRKFLSYIMQQAHYCEHFANLKLNKTIDVGQQPICKYCMIGRSYLWICLAKNCGYLVCDRNNKDHLKMHLQQSKTKKAFHSIFINIITAQIMCIDCKIEIYDLEDIKSSEKLENKQDPYLPRLKILPSLSYFDNQASKIMGQLENSEGHRKISKALTGYFGNRKNYALNSALQFLMQFELFRDIVLTLKPFNKEIQEIGRIFKESEEAYFRAISTNELTKQLIHETPSILGYRRKDPFEHVLSFMTKIHEHIKYYTLSPQDSEYDEWDLLSNPSTAPKANLNCPLFDNTSITLSLNYSCAKCNREQSLPANINFLKLNIPRKKRKAKEVEKELADHRFGSPLKDRKKSLTKLFQKQQQCPLTMAEMVIQFLKQPIHKDKICIICKQPLKKNKLHFTNLPQYLMIQTNRMGLDGNSVDMTKIEFSTESIDFGPFTTNKNSSIVYQFETAICVENVCSYPVVAMNKFNKQAYIFKNQIVSMLKMQKNPPNPYVICYRRYNQNNTKLKDYYQNIRSNVEVEKQVEESMKVKGLSLPDFWLCQLKHQIARPLINQRICKHGKLRPKIQTKMKDDEKIPVEVYEYLTQKFQGQKYIPEECADCLSQLGKIKERKKLEKQKIIEYEKLKPNCYCMVSNIWLKKWTNFLYGKSPLGYLTKGHPMPGPIDNKPLLDGQKCRGDLIKNQDFKVVNIFIWKLLKQLYGGGPQIRYKWNKNQLSSQDECKIKEIRNIGHQIKSKYAVSYVEHLRKTSMILEKTTSFVDSIRGSEDAQQLSLPEDELR